MMKLVQYCLKELVVVKNILSIDNSNFYKRCIARLIAVRTDDFIKLCFALNKRTINIKKIKDELNALEGLYKEFFKTQRDKYGAHVQDVSFTERIELWVNIDFDKASFFSDQPIEIYNMLSSVPDYIDDKLLFAGSTTKEGADLAKINRELDIENSPMMSSDILALTRYNTGGMLFGTAVQGKAGVLKSLEIIVHYEQSVLKVLQDNSELSNVFKKLIILDIVSYCDNLFTRTDLAAGAKQEMDGFDILIDSSRYPVASKLLYEFKRTYQLQLKIAKIRDVRNIVCGHITPSMTVQDLEAKLNSISIDELSSFYAVLENLFHQICAQEFTLRPFLLRAQKIRGVISFEHIPQKSFAPNDVPKTFFNPPDVNSEAEITKFYKKLINNEELDDVKDFFWQGFERSQLIETRNQIVEITEGHKNHQNIDFRKHHEFFRDKLKANDVDSTEKVAILDLFVRCKGGYPESLKEILLETYGCNSADLQLNYLYLIVLGELTGKRESEVFKILTENFDSKGFLESLYRLISLFKIDVHSRIFGVVTNTDESENEYSKFIKDKIMSCGNPFRRLNYILILAGEFVFGKTTGIANGKLSKIYGEYFKEVFDVHIRAFLKPLMTKEGSEEDIQNIINAFNNNRLATSIALMSIILQKNEHDGQSKNFLQLLAGGLIKIAENDDQEVNNLGFAFVELKQFPQAISVFKFLTEKNPSKIAQRITLLQLYKDAGMTDDYSGFKKDLLANYQLSKEERKTIETV